MPHLHKIEDRDKHFIIDPITKKIQLENPEKNKLVRYDHNSERYTFEMDRMIEGHDMSLCDIVQIHYINVASNKQTKNEDIYEVEDLGLLEENDNKIAFTWLISRNATMLDGMLTFAIRFACSNGNSIDYELHTEIFSSISISNTIFNDGQSIIEEYSDILNQWKKELFSIEGSIRTELKESLAGKIDKQQGTENVGKALIVGEDGNVVLEESKSGVCGEKWRFLRTVTVPADPKTDQSGVVWKLNSDGDVIRFAFDTDANGQKFSLDDVRWYGKTVIDVKISNETRSVYLTSIDKVDISMYRMTIHNAKSLFGSLIKTNDRLYPLEFYNEEYSQTPKIICGTGNQNGGFNFNKKITAFGFLNVENVIKVGTAFHIYGRSN